MKRTRFSFSQQRTDSWCGQTLAYTQPESHPYYAGNDARTICSCICPSTKAEGEGGVRQGWFSHGVGRVAPAEITAEGREVQEGLGPSLRPVIPWLVENAAPYGLGEKE